MEEERSSSFSSGSPLLQSSGSESEKEDVSPVSKAKAKGPGVPPSAGKPPPKAALPLPPKSGTLPPPPPPAGIETASRREKAFANGDPFSLPVSPRQSTEANQMLMGSYIRASVIRTRDTARPVSNCVGVFKSATKAHRPKVGTCPWAPLAGKP